MNDLEKWEDMIKRLTKAIREIKRYESQSSKLKVITAQILVFDFGV
jgi:hypothetical protein